jgi:hypothetical protein
MYAKKTLLDSIYKRPPSFPHPVFPYHPVKKTRDTLRSVLTSKQSRREKKTKRKGNKKKKKEARKTKTKNKKNTNGIWGMGFFAFGLSFPLQRKESCHSGFRG